MTDTIRTFRPRPGAHHTTDPMTVGEDAVLARRDGRTVGVLARWEAPDGGAISTREAMAVPFGSGPRIRAIGDPDAILLPTPTAGQAAERRDVSYGLSPTALAAVAPARARRQRQSHHVNMGVLVASGEPTPPLSRMLGTVHVDVVSAFVTDPDLRTLPAAARTPIRVDLPARRMSPSPLPAGAIGPLPGGLQWRPVRWDDRANVGVWAPCGLAVSRAVVAAAGWIGRRSEDPETRAASEARAERRRRAAEGRSRSAGRPSKCGKCGTCANCKRRERRERARLAAAEAREREAREARERDAAIAAAREDAARTGRGAVRMRIDAGRMARDH